MTATGYPVSEVLRALRGGLNDDDPDVVPAVHVSVPYRFTSPREPPLLEVKYGRENNPTTMLFENAVRIAEGSKWCLAFNTGMAALHVALEVLRGAGARRVVASRLLYGTTRSLLDRHASSGLQVHYYGPPWGQLLRAVKELAPDAVLVETIGNPTLRVPPLRGLVEACGDDCTLIVDNTFASPYLYRPAALSRKILVVESVTKYIGGHHDVLGGVLCGNDADLHEAAWSTRKMTGTVMQPIDAFLAARGLKTLHLRVEYSSRSAEQIARRLEEEPLVERVYYPGLRSHPDSATAREVLPGLYGGVLSFDVGDSRVAKAMLKRLQLVVPSPSLGGVESVVAYPFESSHRSLSEEEKKELGITPGLLRLSVGLEDPVDVLNDILSALRSARA